MAVDRGELRYKIQVEDKFTDPIRKFRQELLLAKGTIDLVKESTLGFKNLKVEVDGARRSTKQFRDEKKQEAQEDRQQRAEQLRRLREIAAAQKLQGQNEKIRASLAKEISARQEQAAKVEAETAKRQARAAADAAKGAADAKKRNQDLFKSLLATNDAANRVAFTFRRLFGILAAFTVARQAVGAFTGLVGASIQFNRTIEDTEVGLASLFTTLGNIRNAQGQLVEGANAFAEAQKLARDQIRELQKDAVRTSATFEELVKTFQVAIAPGLNAGFNLDEIRKLTTLVSQAAAAISVPQDQLAEELRALLIPGAATSRTSRIFTALNIKPEELKRAKEGGRLFEFLEGRLKTFDLAAEASQRTFTGLLARLRDALGIASGTGGFVFFEELKGLLRDVGDAFLVVEKGADGAIKSITPDPKAVATLAILFAGLKDAATTLRQGFKDFNLTQVQNAVAGIAEGFRIAAQVGLGFIQGLTAGFGDVFSIVQRITGGLNSPVFKELVALITRLAVVFGGLGFLLKGILGTAKLILLPFTVLSGVLVNVGKSLAFIYQIVKLIPGKAGLGLWTAAIAAIFFGFEQIFQKILDTNLTIGDVAKIIGLSFETAFKFVVGQGEIIFKQFANLLVGIFTAPISTIANLFLDLTQSVLEIGSGLAAVIPGMEDFRLKVEDTIASLQGLGRRKTPELFPKKDIEKQKAGLIDLVASTQKAFDDIAADIAVRNANDEFKFPVTVDTDDAQGEIAKIIASISTSLDGLLGADIVDEQGLVDALEKAQKAIEGTLGSLEGKASNQILTEFEKTIQGIIIKSSNFLTILESGVQGFADTAASAIVDAFDPTKDVDIGERFARFLQGLAQQILSTLIQLLVATAIAKAFGVPLPTDTTPPPSLGRAEGGSIPGGHAAPAIARPAGLDPRDTTPIWAQPGEFMQQLSAVRKYGLGVMEAINQGAIDPTALRSLAGLGSHRQIRRSSKAGAGYATGGTIVPGITQAQSTAARAADRADAAAPPIALVAGNEQSMDRLLSGGKRAMLDFIKSNAPAIEGMLGRNRSS